MELHPNDVTLLQKKVDGLLEKVSNLESGLKNLEDTCLSQAKEIRALQRNLATKDEPAPSKKRKVALQPKTTKEVTDNVN